MMFSSTSSWSKLPLAEFCCRRSRPPTKYSSVVGQGTSWFATNLFPFHTKHNLLNFTTMLQFSKRPLLNCFHVKEALDATKDDDSYI